MHLEAVREEPLMAVEAAPPAAIFVRLEIATEFFILSADQSWMGRSKIYQVGIGNKGHQKGLNWPSWKVYLVLV